jgi:hypothetical protein
MSKCFLERLEFTNGILGYFPDRTERSHRPSRCFPFSVKLFAMKKNMLLCAAVMLSGCRGSTEAESPVMVERQHAHYHVHGTDVAHGHNHDDFSAGGHTHEHDNH